MTAGFVALYLIANILAFVFGAWITPLNALVLIGADMVLRDRLQYEYGMVYSLACCGLAGVVTVLMSPAAGMIAAASVVSVVLAGFASAMTFRVKAGNFFDKAVPANIASAGIDSLIFPAIAFGSIMLDVSFAQFLAKVVGAAFILYLYKRITKQ